MAVAKTEGAEQGRQAGAAPRAGLVMAILLLVFFLGNSDNQMISPLLPMIARDFGIEVGQVGRMMGPAYALAAATAALLIGPVSDRYGRRRFLLYASAVFAASLLLVAVIRDPRTLAAVRIFTGLAAGTFSTCSIAYVGDYFPYERRGVAMSVVQAGAFGALVVGVPVANQVAQSFGWRISFSLFGVISMVAFALIALMLPEDRQQMAEQNLADRVARRFDNVRVVFESRERVASIAAAFFVSGGFVGFFFYLGSWLRRSLGLSAGEVNLFFIVVGLATLVGAFVSGPVADKFGKRGLSLLSTFLLAPMLLLIPFMNWGLALFACFLIASLAFAFRQGPLQALATELVPRRARGALVALRNTASQVGIAVATVASGVLFDRIGYDAVGLFSGLMTLGAAFCIMMMSEPRTATSAGEASQAITVAAKKPPSAWRVVRRIMVTLITIVAVLVLVVFPYWISTVATNATTRRIDRQQTETPATYGAEFKDVEFETADGVKISGWLLPSRGRNATIVYSHGLFRSRRELLERAVELWRLGYGALLYDSRNHGASGQARVGLGYPERLDSEAAVRYLRDEEKTTDRIVLFGISMGATAALLAAAETPDVAAAISDSSFLSFEDTVDHHVRLFLHLPAFPLANEVRFFIERRARFDGSRLDALDAVRRIGDRPVLFIAAAHDERMPPEIARKLYDAAASPKRDLLIIDGPESDIHGHAYQSNPRLYIDRVSAFLKAALGE